MDHLTIRISDHAFKRFVERSKFNQYPVPDTPEKIEAKIRRLLASAEPEKLDRLRLTKRLLNNGAQDAEYFVHSGWRFVISNNVVVTIERVKPEQNGKLLAI